MSGFKIQFQVQGELFGAVITDSHQSSHGVREDYCYQRTIHIVDQNSGRRNRVVKINHSHIRKESSLIQSQSQKQPNFRLLSPTVLTYLTTGTTDIQYVP